MPRITHKAAPSNRTSLLTTIVLLLLLAWLGAALMTIWRANLYRNETLDTMQRAFDNRTLNLERRIRELEGRVPQTATGSTVTSPTPLATPASTARPGTRAPLR